MSRLAVCLFSIEKIIKKIYDGNESAIIYKREGINEVVIQCMPLQFALLFPTVLSAFGRLSGMEAIGVFDGKDMNN